MDLIGPIFYGIVCGAVGAAAPSFGSAVARIAAGAAIGVISALLLPHVRAMIGG